MLAETWGGALNLAPRSGEQEKASVEMLHGAQITLFENSQWIGWLKKESIDYQNIKSLYADNEVANLLRFSHDNNTIIVYDSETLEVLSTFTPEPESAILRELQRNSLKLDFMYGPAKLFVLGTQLYYASIVNGVLDIKLIEDMDFYYQIY